QIIDLIDHAVTKHGKKVKFLTFREAQERLNKNVLAGHPLRDPKTGGDNGVVMGMGDNGYASFSIRDEKDPVYRYWALEGGKWGWKSVSTRGARPLSDLEVFQGYTILHAIHLGGKKGFAAGNSAGTDHAVFVPSDKTGTLVKTGWSLPPG